MRDRSVAAASRAVPLTLALALAGCAHGSVYRGQHVHVGVRPAAANGAEGLTIQVSTDALP